MTKQILKNVLITGISSGIGYETTKMLLAQGFRVFGSVRKAADAERCKTDFGPHFTPLIFDLEDDAAIAQAKEKLVCEIGPLGLDVLINNAGIAFAGPVLHQPIKEYGHHLNVNVLGTLRVLQTFALMLKADKTTQKLPGRIINISSVSGLVTRPFMGAYSSSKFAVEAMSDALRRELMPLEIKVIIIEPGVIKTPIWSKAKVEKPRYQDTDFAPIMKNLNAEISHIEEGAISTNRVVKIIYKALLSPHPRTRYLVTANNLFMWLAVKILSDRTLDKMFSKRSIHLAKN